MILSEVLVPLLNANEPEARLVSIHVKEGQLVRPGMVLFTLETTKAASEVEASKAGFIRLLSKEGDLFEVGQRLAVITETADEAFEQTPAVEASNKETGTNMTPSDLRITKPALALAKTLGVDLSTLPTSSLVTEAVVRQHSPQAKSPIVLAASDKPYIMIYGAGGHAKTIMEMILQLGEYSIAGILDDNEKLKGLRVLGLPVLGTRSRLPELAKLGVRLSANGVGGILDINVRVKVFQVLESAGFELPALIHPRATVEPSAQVGAGVQVFANAYVGTEAVLQPKCMVNTNAVVSHDCEIGPFTHIAPGALLAGHVHVGARSLIGMGVTTSIGIKIGSDVRVGNGAILLADVPDRTIIQAGRFWTGRAENQK